MQTKTATRPVWSGAISFGLVTIPVKLYTAVREQNIHFRSLHDQDMVPLKMKYYCPADGKEVHREHIVKGYEIAKDQFVVINQEEIDPLYFDRPYYVGPTPEGAKPYKLLLEAMEKKGKVGIAKVVLWNKEYLCALRPVNGVLCLETMHFDDEVVAPHAVVPTEAKHRIDEREMKIAGQLIDSLSTHFKPDKYHDEYREKIMELVEKKASGEEIVTRPAEEAEAPRTKNLIAALEASLAKARPSARAHLGQHTRRRKSA